MRGLLASLFSFYEVQLNVTADSIGIDLNDKKGTDEYKLSFHTNILWNSME